MPADAIIISSVIISVVGALGVFLARLHIKGCKSICCESDCRSPPNTPENSVNDVYAPISHRRSLSKVISEIFNKKIEKYDLEMNTKN
jgi:hypothetical protein